jgi:hypothetical protein
VEKYVVRILLTEEKAKKQLLKLLDLELIKALPEVIQVP